MNFTTYSSEETEMHPIVYFSSSSFAVAIAERYGPYLECLDIEDLLRIRAIISLYQVFRRSSEDSHQDTFNHVVDTTAFYDGENLLETDLELAEIIGHLLEAADESTINNFLEGIQYLIAYNKEECG